MLQLVANPHIAKCVLGYNPVNERMMSIRIQGKPANISIVQVYAPTSSANEDVIETFYDDLQQTIDDTPKRDILILTGDFNSKVGDCSTNSNVMGNNGLGEQNERGERLVEFCDENGFVIVNTLFKQHPRRLYTWTSPNQKTRNQIDYIMVKRRWRSSCVYAKTHPGADCGSDHQLLVAGLRMKLRRIKAQKKPARLDMAQIDDQKNIGPTNTELKSRIDFRHYWNKIR